MLEEKPIIVNKNGVKTKDYWKRALQIMKNYKKFLERLEKYDKNNLSPALKKIIETEYMTLEEFTPERIRNASEAAEGIAKWVIALVKYDTVYQTIVPKRKAAEAAQADLQVILDALAVKQKELQDLVEKSNKL
jgi:dynein heavy chain